MQSIRWGLYWVRKMLLSQRRTSYTSCRRSSVDFSRDRWFKVTATLISDFHSKRVKQSVAAILFVQQRASMTGHDSSTYLLSVRCSSEDFFAGDFEDVDSIHQNFPILVQATDFSALGLSSIFKSFSESESVRDGTDKLFSHDYSTELVTIHALLQSCISCSFFPLFCPSSTYKKILQASYSHDFRVM